MELTASTSVLSRHHAVTVSPGSFVPREHFYPRVLNAQIHPLVAFFLRLSNARIVERYCHLNPRVDTDRLSELLAEPATHLKWAGADLFCTTTAAGNRRLVVLETNSCPSGNKSMPPLREDDELAGYRTVIERAFLPNLQKRGAIDGDLAVLYDKNYMEASGYAATIADLTGESVHLTPMLDGSEDSPARFNAGVLEVRLQNEEWRPIRAAFRYVTQRPWTRIPVRTRTRILNPIVGCLAGGRNKLVASKAYDLYNAELDETGLQVYTPETVADVAKPEIPLLVARFGGHAVVKIPYGNAGQGVFPILSQRELDDFMDADHPYDRFIVQSLVGNYAWSSAQAGGRFYHVGTMPDRRGDIYVADLRMMICSGPDGVRPVAVYARRAPKPLPRELHEDEASWAFLGTNLSSKKPDGSWAADTDRLLLMDRKDFNRVGIGADDLIEAYIQTVLATKAIDKMAATLLTKKGSLRYKLFSSLDEDPTLIAEIRQGSAGALTDSAEAS
jgi:hypothetical protein